jgi:predicted nucleic acid-binding protein
MPDGELVVADTSPLLNLALIGRLDLLREQFDGVTATEQVWDELAAGDDGLDDLRALRDEGFLELVPVEESSLFVELRRELDRGEAAALAYAIDADADLVLLDERDARRVARRHDRSVTGVIGVLLRAAERDRIDLRDALDRLRVEGWRNCYKNQQ